jgi:hypothetical protein
VRDSSSLPPSSSKPLDSIFICVLCLPRRSPNFNSQTIRKDPYPSASLFLFFTYHGTLLQYPHMSCLHPCFTLVTHAIPKPVSQAMLLPCYMYPVMMPCSLFSYPLSEDLYVVLSCDEKQEL